MSSVVEIWENEHRGELHTPSSWDMENASITYIPSNLSATSEAQLEVLSKLYPSSSHPFNKDQLTRYNNRWEQVSVSWDAERRHLVEELIINASHQERLDYFVPGLEATKKSFLLPVIVFAKYSKNSDLLENVRIWWDQASLLKQLDHFQLSFNNLIHMSARHESSFNNALSSLPIPDPSSTAHRIIHPSQRNGNSLLDLQNLLKERNLDGPLENVRQLRKNLPTSSRKDSHDSSSKIFLSDSPTLEWRPEPPSGPTRLAENSSNMNSLLTDNVQLNAVSSNQLKRSPSNERNPLLPENGNLFKNENYKAIRTSSDKLSRTIFDEQGPPSTPRRNGIDASHFKSSIFVDKSDYRPTIGLDPSKNITSNESIFSSKESVTSKEDHPKAFDDEGRFKSKAFNGGDSFSDGDGDIIKNNTSSNNRPDLSSNPFFAAQKDPKSVSTAKSSRATSHSNVPMGDEVAIESNTKSFSGIKSSGKSNKSSFTLGD